MPEPNPFLQNPHLAGAPFFLEGTGPNAVLLYHGFTATCSEVYRLGRVLNRLGFSVCAPLMPGHGTHPDDLNRVRWQDWAAAAEREYQALAQKYARVLVGGESTGALLALHLAAAHPEIAAVLAYAPALRLPLTWQQRLAIPLLALAGYHMPKGDLTGNSTWQGYKVNPVRALQELIRLQKQVEPRLGQIHQPILLVQGRNDHTILPKSSEIVYERVSSPVKELHWMEKSGHCVLLEDEAHEVHRLTMDFIFKIGAKG